MVFVPGGGFVAGQGGLATYDGTYLAAAGNVVVVTINYRLGALGFLRYTDNTAGVEGNYGIKDQVLALQWVQQNIGAFGGDPGRVTLFGESAGAMSVGLHLFSVPQSNDLFHAAIMESNPMSVPYANTEVASTRGAGFVDKLCDASKTNGTCPETAEWLRSLSLDTIMKTEVDVLGAGGMAGLLINGIVEGMLWAPTVGASPVTAQGYVGYQPGTTPKPYVYGTNRDEGVFFTPFPSTYTEADYRATLATNFGAGNVDTIIGYERDGTRPYDPASYLDKDGVGGLTAPAWAVGNMITHYGFTCATIRSANAAEEEMNAAGLPTFGYFFTEHSNFNYPGFERCDPASGNVCHTAELPYVFHNLVARSDGKIFPAKDVTADEMALATTMAGAWAGFAHTHDASGFGHAPLADPNSGPYVDFRTGTPTIDDLGDIANCELWEPLYPK